MITVVTGPPCGGKSTYIRENAEPGDIVIDMDLIALALTFGGVGSHAYPEKVRGVARAARNAAVKQALAVAQGERRLGVWIIHTDPGRDAQQMYRVSGARFVEVNPGKQVCLERLQSRPVENHKIARAVIDKYFEFR
jgi:hypothetical protein